MNTLQTLRLQPCRRVEITVSGNALIRDMQVNATAGPCWSTASFGDTADTKPMELSALGEHLDLCRSLSGRLFVLRCGAEAVQGFVAARFVTTLVVLALLIGLGSLAW